MVKGDDMNIETLDRNLRVAGIPTQIENTGGNVMTCWIGTWEGDFHVSPSEVDPSTFMLGLYDRDGEEIEFIDGMKFDAVVARISKQL